MAEPIIYKTTFRFKRGKADTWTSLNPILDPGEPGFEIDTYKLKIGNGESAWNDLEYYSGSVQISVDGKSLIITDDGTASIYGFIQAQTGQVPAKNSDGTITWITPISDESLQKAVQEATLAAERASQSAIESGNQATLSGIRADNALQILNQVNRKIWFGTKAEYNALQVVYDDSIYCILDEN